MKDFIINFLFNRKRYRTSSEAVIVACYYNPQKSPYRTKAFKIFYDSIKHLNHRIIECVIGDAQPELDINSNSNYIITHSNSMLWHKEGLINHVVRHLPSKFKYVFWLDADVIFENLDWMVNGVEQLKYCNIIQPFGTCVHLDKDELRPKFNLDEYQFTYLPNEKNPKVWHSFCSNYTHTNLWKDENYNTHGHVGFAWGAKRLVLDKVPLYDKALIGGADHIIAHAAAGQINHPCIVKSFTDDIEEVNKWSRMFAQTIDQKIGYVPGNLYHIWHGDIEKRQYLKRIKDFTGKAKTIVDKDDNGLYIGGPEHVEYVKNYIKSREVPYDDGFATSMMAGFITDDAAMGAMIGGNPIGAMLGDMLNIDDQQSEPVFEFGGGQSGGGGAGGTWDETPKVNESDALTTFWEEAVNSNNDPVDNSYDPNDNFS